ncbi:MAG TPA: hypothetical protein VEW08_17940 [Steroidobacteraceae bacterium]|nr:hypothetical protein [Steroidobacteraceae bacterium]
MSIEGQWLRHPGGRILLFDEAPGEFEFEFELDKHSPKTPPPSNALKAGDVNVASIDLPARDSLLRLAAVPKTRKAAVELLDHVKAGRIDGIRCLRSTAAMARVKRLGYDPADAIRAGNDAVVLLDPTDLRGGKPMIAIRHELDPRCGSAGASPPTSAAIAKFDAALLKSLASFSAWREGISLGRSAKCALAPLDDPGRTGLGNVLPRLIRLPYAMPAAPGAPKLVRHRHTSYKCNSAFSFVPDGTPVDLLPANMRPHFVAPDDRFMIVWELQNQLHALLKEDAFKDLVNRSRTAATLKAEESDRLHLAVVNLSGRGNLCEPGLAHYGAQFNEWGGSTPKILIVYAAHQLHFDLEQMVAADRIRDFATLEKKAAEEWKVFSCKPRLELFKFTAPATSSGLLKVEMSVALNTLLREMTANTGYSTARASTLILKIGFEYLASLAWQSGLRHPTRGGIWYGTTYCTDQKPDATDLACYGKDSETKIACPSTTPRVFWKADPMKIYGVRGSALSFATYMTLLAQGRLVDATNSARIEALLKNACGVAKDAGVLGIRAQKCAWTDTTLHDAVLIEREVVRGARRRTLRYVIAFTCRLKNKGDPALGTMHALIRRIDTIMEERALA